MEKYTIEWHYDGFTYVFHTLASLFSYRQVDLGTRQMIEQTDLRPDCKVLDLGCGYGVVGIWAAHTIGAEKVVMSDVNIAALKIAAENVKANNLDKIQLIHSNGFDHIHDVDFSLIMSNPPYHTDFAVAKEFIEGSYKHLQLGGSLGHPKYGGFSTNDIPLVPIICSPSNASHDTNVPSSICRL